MVAVRKQSPINEMEKQLLLDDAERYISEMCEDRESALIELVRIHRLLTQLKQTEALDLD